MPEKLPEKGISPNLKQITPGLWGRKIPNEERQIDPGFVRKLGEMSGSEQYKEALNNILNIVNNKQHKG